MAATTERNAHRQSCAVSVESLFAVAMEYAAAVPSRRLSTLCSAVCDIFAADGCAIAQDLAALTSKDRATYLLERSSRFPVARIYRLLNTHRPGASAALLGPDDGGPMIVVSSIMGLLVTYRSDSSEGFPAEHAKLLCSLWHSCASFESKNVPMAIPEVSSDSGLPRRLRQVLNSLLHGHAEKEIAQQLQISHHTVHIYVKNLYRTFGVRSRNELLVRCLSPSHEKQEDPPSIANCHDNRRGVKLPQRQVQPADQIIPTPRPVAAVPGVPANMFLG